MLQAVDRCGAIPATARPAPFPRGPFRVGLLALAAAMALAGCNDDGSTAKSASAPAQPVAAIPAPADTPQPAVVQAAYTPPAADVLYQMVAPIALYPDKLVAQILAGSTYPDQVSAAEMWLAQNPGLKGAALSNGANAQPWDPSIKSLTQFPNVLGQMASNLPWTTALGKAYYNDPADVMNAIQVMRSRAYKAGSLKSSSQLKVKRLADAPPVENYIPADVMPAMPVSAPVIAPPPEFIEIAPAEPSMVYVPQYDPTVVYGEPMPVYGGYSYIAAPPPVFVGNVATPVVAGLIGFGVGITINEVVDHHHRPWGWDSWRMHWGEPGRPGYWREGQRPPPPLARPAVVYNHQTYVSQSTTVVENVRVNNNASRFGAARPAPEMTAPPGPGPALAAGAIAAGAAAAGGYALSQRHPPQPPQGAAPFPGREPPNQQPPRGLTMAQQLGRPQPPAQPGDQARHESPEQQRAQQQATLNAQQQTMERQRAQQFMQRPPQDQAQQQRMQEQQVRQQQAAQQRSQQDQAHQQQLAQQRAQEQQARQQQEAQQQTQQRALQRNQQDQAHQQQLAQQRAQEQQTRQQQAAQQQAQQQATQRNQQDQAHQQQLAQQRAQEQQARQQQAAQQQAMQRAQQEQARQQQQAQQRAQEQQARQQQAAQQQAMQRAQQEQAHQQQMAQQRAQEQQARQQQAAQQQAMQRAQQEQAHQQQMAQQRAQEQQMRQQQAAQQRAQQEQMHQQQMAQQRAQEQQMRQQQAAQQHAQQQAMQRAQQQQMFHQAREGRRGDRPER
ncbi:hypothetical protein GCM10027082_06870 [Comamonas humi]